MLVELDPEEGSPADLAAQLRSVILSCAADLEEPGSMPWSAGLDFEEVSFRCKQEFKTGTAGIEVHDEADDVEVELTANAGLSGPMGGKLIIEIPNTQHFGRSAPDAGGISIIGEDSVEAVAASPEMVACLVGLESFGIPIAKALLHIVHSNGEVDGITPQAARSLVKTVRLKQM